MTRKDYELIASAIDPGARAATVKATIDGPPDRRLQLEGSERAATALARENSRFDAGKFHAAINEENLAREIGPSTKG